MNLTQVKQKESSKITTVKKTNRSFWNLFITKTSDSFLKTKENSLEKDVSDFIKEYHKTFRSLSKK